MEVNVPLMVLLAFAGWTVLLLTGTIGVYRWSRILSGRATIREWRADVEQGSDWYRRAMRAHMNCVENLPVFGAVVVAIVALGIEDAWIDRLALGYLAARIAQSLVHVAFEQTEAIAALRFALFFAQVAAVFAIGARIVPAL